MPNRDSQAPSQVSPCVLSVVEGYLSDLDTPRSLATWLMAKYGEWNQLVAQKIHPAHYLEFQCAKFARDYCATEFLRKCSDLPTGIDREAATLDNFFSSERQCSLTNVRLAPYVQWLATPDHTLCYRNETIDDGIERFIVQVRADIKALLGPLPAWIEGRFGKGTTFELNDHPCRSNLVLGDKIENGVAFTSSAAPLSKFYYETAAGRALVREFPSQSAPRIVRGNRFFSVPKDATKNRGCCAEPGGNVFLQLGFGRCIRTALERWGLDLSQGQSLHGAVVAAASLNGQLATIDLTSASDTVSRAVVKLLLPAEWYAALNSVRSPLTRVNGKWYRLEKFSSMGNGFTFELETLIFAAICRGVGVKAPMVYGDDIIVPTAQAKDVLAALKFFGFTPNERKTYVETSFRESCGTDAFAGLVVRPYRMEAFPTDVPSWISCHNGILRARGGRSGEGSKRVIAQLPNRYRLFGPAGLGDFVLHSSASKWRPEVRSSIRYFRGVRRTVKTVEWSHFRPETQLAMFLYGLPRTAGPVGESHDVELMTRNLSGFRIAKQPYS